MGDGTGKKERRRNLGGEKTGGKKKKDTPRGNDKV